MASGARACCSLELKTLLRQLLDGVSDHCIRFKAKNKARKKGTRMYAAKFSGAERDDARVLKVSYVSLIYVPTVQHVRESFLKPSKK